jgi:hypothetical protein
MKILQKFSCEMLHSVQLHAVCCNDHHAPLKKTREFMSAVEHKKLRRAHDVSIHIPDLADLFDGLYT